MKQLPNPKSDFYIKKYPFQTLFSFPIKPFVKVFEFQKGEFIFKEGSYPEYLYYMVDGKAKIYVTHKNGKVSLINITEAPAFMGEIELLNEEFYTKGIQAATKAICLAIPVKQCKDLLLSDAVFLRHLCIILSKKESDISKKYSQNQAYPLINRLAAFILLSADKDLYKEKHTEVSEYLGVSYRHLLHVFNQLAAEGIISKTGKGYKIIDKEQLHHLAGEL